MGPLLFFCHLVSAHPILGEQRASVPGEKYAGALKQGLATAPVLAPCSALYANSEDPTSMEVGSATSPQKRTKICRNISLTSRHGRFRFVGERELSFPIFRGLRNEEGRHPATLLARCKSPYLRSSREVFRVPPKPQSRDDV